MSGSGKISDNTDQSDSYATPKLEKTCKALHLAGENVVLRGIAEGSPRPYGCLYEDKFAARMQEAQVQVVHNGLKS